MPNSFPACLLTFLLLASLPAGAVSLGGTEKNLESYQQSPSPGLEEDLAASATELLDAAISDRANRASTKRNLLDAAQLAVKVRETIFGEKDLRTIAAIYDLSRVYRRFGWPTEEEQTLVRSYNLLLGHREASGPEMGAIKMRLAQIRSQNGYEQAAPLIEDAITIFASTVGDAHPVYFEALRIKADLLLSYRRAEDARTLASNSLAILQQTPEYSHATAFGFRSVITSSYLANMQPEAAITHANESLQLVEAISPRAFRTILPCSRRSDEATRLPVTLPVTGACNNLHKETLAAAHEQIYRMYMAAERPDKADRHLKQVERLVGREAVRFEKLLSDRRFDDALKLVDQQVSYITTTFGTEHPTWADWMFNKASIYEELGDTDAAIAHYEAAAVHRIRRSPTQIVKVAQTFQRLGTLYVANDEEKAQWAFERAEQAYALLPSTGRYSEGNFGIEDYAQGIIYMMLGDYERASELYLRSYEQTLQDRGPNHIQTVLALGSLSDLYQGLNYKRKSSEYARQAIEMAKDTGIADLSLIRLMKGVLAFNEKRFEDAIAIWTEVLEADYIPSNASRLIVERGIADALQQSGRYEEALDAFDELRARDYFQLVMEQEPFYRAVFDTAYAESLNGAGRYTEAIPYLESAIPEMSGNGMFIVLWRAYAAMSEALRETGNPVAAIYFAKLAVNSIQTLRTTISSFDKEVQQAFIGDKAAVYRDLADMLIDQGALGEARQVLALLKQHEYSEFIVRDAGEKPQEIAVSTVEESIDRGFRQEGAKLVRLRSAISELERQGDLDSAEEKRLDELKSELRNSREKFQRELRNIQAEFAQLGVNRILELGEKNLNSLGQVQGLLARMDDGTAVLHYLVMPEKVRILVTTRDNQYSASSPISSRELNQLLFDFRGALESLDSEVIPLGDELYRHLVSPIEAELAAENIRKLMVSLDSTLRYIPLAALHDGESYLAERYQVSRYTPAAQVAMGRPPSKDWRVAGFGVSEHVGGFAPLPAVRQELDSIVREGDDDPTGILPGASYIDSSFTAESLASALQAGREDPFQVIHLASHFAFQPGREADSYLVLGGGEKWTMDDLRYGDYSFANVDLLTLSACNTGMGGVGADGSEVEGFGALAQNRGAASVIATLWPVADESTGNFMKRFYELKSSAENISKAAAIQVVQQEFLSGEYSHPFFWAPFVLMGNQN